jgi:hypothetical protein
MIREFNAVTEWITPQTASKRSPGVDMWKLGSNGSRLRLVLAFLNVITWL